MRAPIRQAKGMLVTPALDWQRFDFFEHFVLIYRLEVLFEIATRSNSGGQPRATESSAGRSSTRSRAAENASRAKAR